LDAIKTIWEETALGGIGFQYGKIYTVREHEWEGKAD